MANEVLVASPPVNSSFSTALPSLQLAIDSTSLGAFKECPRKYYYSIVLGYVPKAESVHLTFGLLLHGGAERYSRAKARGASHDEALDAALDWTLVQSWDKRLGRPWQSDHPQKNRASLIRTLVWYLDQYGENDPFQTVLLGNGQPAVELSFRFDSQYTALTGEPILFCGHLDRIVEFNDGLFVSDIKTTGNQLGNKFFAQFNPNNQFSMYDVACKVAFGTEIDGLIVDGCQIGVNFTRFQRAPVNRPSALREEWYKAQAWWLEQMGLAAVAADWPMNDKSCGNYGGCPYQDVCSKVPAARPRWLAANFTKRIWDPLQVRGDI